ncbi:MAG: hypothetical protein QOH64_3268 [Acidimicrobiaceae bacterium]
MIATKARRLVGRTCLIGAAVALLAGVAPWHATAQTSTGGSHPQIFSTASEAMAVDYVPDQQGGLTPIQDTFHSQFVAGASTMSSSNGPSARAALVDPGNGVTKGPATACGQLGPLTAAFPELGPIVQACTNSTWPFLADADGFNTDPSTAGAVAFGTPNGPLYGQGGAAHAHVGDDGTSSTDSIMNSLRIAPLPGGDATGLPLPGGIALPGQTPGAPAADTSIFSVGSITAKTTNTFDGSNTVVSHAEAVLSGVRLLGGLVTIESITSIADSRFTNGADPVGQSSTTVQGAKVLGQPATIDDKGLTVGDGSGSGNPSALNDAATQAFKDSGLTIKLIGATQGVDDRGFMTAASQGVAVGYQRAVDTGGSGSGTYFVRYNLATVSTRAFDRDLTRPSKSTSSPISKPSITPVSPTPGTTSGFTGGKVVAPLPPQATGASPEVAAPADTSPSGFAGLDPARIKFLYLSFTLATLGVCLVPRLALPARLPGRVKA